MKPIAPPLNSGDRGGAVGNLQDALLLLLDKRLIHAPAGSPLADLLRNERQATAYGQGTAQAVTFFQEKHHLRATGTVDAATADAINNFLKALKAIQADPDTVVFAVQGQVVSRERAGVGGLRVAIVDRSVGASREAPLAEATTGADGRYRAHFTIAGLGPRRKERPDLQARVFVGEVLLGASDVRYNATPRETLNIALTSKASTALPSELETLTSDVTAYFKGPLRELKEGDERQDITYLANKTGWDARAVALAALADEFSARTADAAGTPQLDSPFFYALFRAGHPANERALARITPQRALDIWKEAVALGVIPASLESTLPQAAERLHRLVVERSLNGPALAGLSSLKEMLEVSLGNDPARHQRFAELNAQHKNQPDKLWDAVRSEFGAAAEARLRVDAQLAYLTRNNAPLMRKLHTAAGQAGLTDSVNLAEQGYFRAAKWRDLIGQDVVPPEIPGEGDEQRRAHYAEVLAAEVRLSFPTMVVAQMVGEGETPIAPDRREQVRSFLVEQHGKFEIGLESAQRYIARHALDVPADVSKEIARIQRVYQITPSDAAMNALLRRGVGSAQAVARYDRGEFVEAFKDDLGGEQNARLIHAKAQQVHNIVLNLATSYLVARTAPQLGVHSAPKYGATNPALIVQAAEAVASKQVTSVLQYIDFFGKQSPENAGNVIPYATLEALFGEMDYCACDHCRSVLSPAAYLVDLLRFLDLNELASDNPLTVFLNRRPDIEHLPLTCENTNTPLPYIDLINETLEYFITNNLSLDAYQGHSTDDTVTAEELLASPQFVQDQAYETLAGKHATDQPPPLLPPRAPLPFHQPLENLRRYFGKFGVSLPEVMELLRTHDEIERPQPADPANPIEYGWRDILMEELRLSRAEYRLLTDRSLDIPQLYGFDLGELVEDILHGHEAVPPDKPAWAGLSNAKAFSRLMGVSYEETAEILKTRFVNPHSTLVPKLERLGIPLPTLKALKEGNITDAEFDALIVDINPADYGGDVKAWVKNEENYSRIMSLIVLTDPTGEDNAGSFNNVEFRYANPVVDENKLRPFEFTRLFRFIRLWKKLGWTIEQTDKTLTALYPESQKPDSADDAVNLLRLDAGFLTLLPRLGIVTRLIRALKLKPKKDLLPLLACFAPIDTHGGVSLYRQMFLYPAPSEQDSVFADDGFGNFLTKNAGLLDNAQALRAAFLVTDDELHQIVTALKFDSSTPLNIETVSAIFRRGWLARKLKLSVRELLLLIDVTGADPFLPPDPPTPPILQFLGIVWRLREARVKPEQALYAIWNQDITGKAAPDSGTVREFARTLRAAFGSIESEFVFTDDPDGQIARARMTLVYGSEATNVFFGFLDDTFVTTVEYDHPQDTLEEEILAVASDRLTYDDLRKLLSYLGVMTETDRDALQGASANAALKQAVQSLFGENQKIVAPFFDRYPELRPLYELYAFFGQSPGAEAIADFFQDFGSRYPDLDIDQEAYMEAGDSEPKRRTLFLEAVLPELRSRRKRQQALTAVAAAAKADIPLANALLDDKLVLNPAAAPASVDVNTSPPALDDLPALEKTGLSAQFYLGATIGAADVEPAHTSDAESSLAYPATGAGALPVNPCSAVWTGYLEAPENGFYNFRLEPAVAGGTGPASATLTLDGEVKELEKNGEIWSNTTGIEVRAGSIYAISVVAENLTAGLKVRWQTTGRGWEVIPQQYLYSSTLVERLGVTYVRFLKAVSLATALKLTASELAYLASHESYRIAGRGWLNSMPVVGRANKAISAQLLEAFEALLGFATLKAALAPKDERLLAVLRDPRTVVDTTEDAPEIEKSLLLAVTRWDGPSLDALLLRFGKHLQAAPDQADRSALTDLDTFLQVHRAHGPLKKLEVSAAALIAVTTNEPSAPAVRVFKDALRARYEESDWLSVLRPINDEMRSLQRDALVAYIQHQMQARTDSQHIDTPDKLFEYFLMDVQMDPCMQTSRIRHALSSVQLFTERCFMNLEPRVAPEVFKPKQRKYWEWMKRYRVWEANRKVFLWPENWAEPELRTTQSPIFKEAMSELLQSDITEDKAAAALLNYLTKLDEVAKLEPCGIHFVEGETGTTDDIAHVVARTAGANRKYFYRRYDGLWSPWEPIKLDIEDSPVIPVVWKGRLFLFWLKILKDSPPQAPPAPDADTPDVNPVTLIPTELPKVTVRAVLCSSEYYNGKWQSPETSDINQPLDVGSFAIAGTESFARSITRLGIRNGSLGEILIYLSPYAHRYDDPMPSGDIPDYTYVYPAFRLFKAHALPVAEVISRLVTEIDVPTIDTVLTEGEPGEILEISHGKVGAQGVTHQVVKNKTKPLGYVIIPRHRVANAWNAPFFYSDSRHAFYVTTKKEKVPIQDQISYAEASGDDMSLSIAPLTIATHGADTSSSMKGFISEDAYIDKELPMKANVHFGSVVMGLKGRVSSSALE